MNVHKYQLRKIALSLAARNIAALKCNNYNMYFFIASFYLIKSNKQPNLDTSKVKVNIIILP